MQMQRMLLQSHSDTTEKTLILSQGEEAMEWCQNASFQSEWDQLYQSCPWATVFQHRKFVTSWYQVYQQDFTPLIIQYQINHQLRGLLTMAIPTEESGKKKSIKLIGAGKYDAEYQVWLAFKGEGDAFIMAALELVLKKFPKCKIVFRYLPAGTPLDWIQSSFWKQRCILEPVRRPLMDTKHPNFAKLLKKRHLKAKYNRFRKVGPLRLVQIQNYTRFSKLLNLNAVQYDFRQGAMFNKNQFREDPNKALFLKTLFRHGLLNVTALQLKNEIVAFVISVEGKKWIHLAGLITHSPFYSKFSPGLVHLFMLGQKIAFEDVDVFDLTPGDDYYKERLATSFDTTYELVVSENSLYKWKRAIRKKIFHSLVKAGVRPPKLKLQIKKNIYLLKEKSKTGILWNIFSSVSNWGYTKKLNGYKDYPIPICPNERNHTFTFTFNRNSLDDLLEYDPKGPSLTRWEFLENAMKRFENGQVSYSIVENNRLLFCAWVRKSNDATINHDRKTLERSEPPAVIMDYYCQPSAPIDLILADLCQEIISKDPFSTVY